MIHSRMASASADAIVVGAGICGASAAYFLAERGVDVLVLDRAGISRGTTGRGEGNVLVCDKRPGPVRDLALQGRGLWELLGQRFPAARVTPKGALVLDHPNGSDASTLEPALAQGTRALLEPRDLQVDPAGATGALLAEVRGRARVRVGVEVAGVTGGTVTLSTGDRLGCEHVIVATGPWARALTGLPVEPRKGQLVALAASPGTIVHKLIENAYIDAVEDTDEGLAIATVIEQTLDGDEILVGSSRERVGFDDTVNSAVSHAMIDRAAAFVPALRELPVRRAWCGWRPWLPDQRPAVGPLAPGVWASAGHEGSGVCLGPISGLLLAQLICGEPPVADPAPFDPRRFDGRSAPDARTAGPATPT
jgi:glycine/D-amino acid oxidase-like deaminating enzyme